jgi:hypothetical protein
MPPHGAFEHVQLCMARLSASRLDWFCSSSAPSHLPKRKPAVRSAFPVPTGHLVTYIYVPTNPASRPANVMTYSQPRAFVVVVDWSWPARRRHDTGAPATASRQGSQTATGRTRATPNCTQKTGGHPSAPTTPRRGRARNGTIIYTHAPAPFPFPGHGQPEHPTTQDQNSRVEAALETPRPIPPPPPPRFPDPHPMGSLGGDAKPQGARRRPRFLCLHGFRTSGEIMRKQVLGKWPADVTARLDLVFADAPFPAEGKSDVDGIFDPPYYEWFQFDKVRRRARASARPLPAPSPPILPDPVVPAYFSLCLFFCTRAACRWLVRCTYQLDLPTRATHLLPNSLCTVQRKTEFYGVQEFRQVPGLHRRADDKRRPLRRTDGFLPGNKPHSTG